MAESGNDGATDASRGKTVINELVGMRMGVHVVPWFRLVNLVAESGGGKVNMTGANEW